MKRLAIAVLLALLMLSAGLLVPSYPSHQTDSAILAAESQGLGGNEALFDEFTQTLVVGNNPIDQVVADLNNDTFLDIAIIYSNSLFFDIFYGVDGTYSYSNWDRIPLTAYSTDIAVGDMDNNGRNDLVVTINDATDDFIIFNQTLTGFTSTPYPSPQRAHGVVLEDLDNDSYLDVVVLYSKDTPTYESGFQVHFHSENYNLDGCNIQFKSAASEIILARLIYAGFINDDDLVDLVIGDMANGKVVGFINGDSTGWNWTATTVRSAAGLTDLKIEQIDGTGLSEVIISTSTQIDITRYSGGGLTLVNSIADDSGIAALTTLHYSDSVRTDIARVSVLDNYAAVYVTPSSLLNPYNTAEIVFPTPYYPVDVKALDMNSDLSEDLVVLSRSSSGNGTVSIYYQTPETITNANDNQMVNGIDPSLIASGDFDGDGDAEIAAFDASGIVRFLRMGDANIDERGVSTDVSAMISIDLNDDGRDDLIMVTSVSSEVIIWYGSSDFMTGGGSVLTVGCNVTYASSVTTGYLNGDSLLDIAVGGLGGVDVFWNSGAGTLFSNAQRFTLLLSDTNVTSLACGQLNNGTAGDGRMDIAIVNENQSRVEIYYQQSSGLRFTQTVHRYLMNLTQIGEVVSADVNDDDLDDLMTSSGNVLQVFLQMSSLQFGFDYGQTIWTNTIREGLESFAIGDLDDDNVSEMVVSTKNSTIIAYGFTGDIYSGTFDQLSRQTVGATPVLLLIDDMNGDLKDDIIAYSVPSRCVSFYYQNNFAPVASGSVVGSGFVEGSPVSFDGSASTDSVSDKQSLNYTWSFSDGGVAYGKLCSHTFLNDSIVNVTLTVRDQWGLSDSFELPQITIDDLGPTAIANCTETAMGISIIEGETVVHFIDMSTSWPDDIIERSWDFDDGSALSTAQNTTHVFSDGGTYGVTLTVTDEDGSTNITTVQVMVIDIAPTAHFEWVTDSLEEGVAVQFNDRSSPASTADDIISWNWTFGDGGYSTLQNPTHVFDNDGAYYVTLNVTDSDGITDIVGHWVEIVDTSPISVTIRTLDGLNEYDEAEEITFVVNASASWSDIKNYSWDFSGTNFVEDLRTTVSSASHNYSTSGLVRITVRVWDNDSFTESYIEITIINLAPDANFTYQINGGNVRFNATTSSDTENDLLIGLQYRWYIEGAWTVWSSDPVKDYEFSQGGTYPVKLEVRDDNSKIDNMTRLVTLELNGPTIELIEPILRVNVSEPITVRATVTDASGVGSVVLQYVIGDVTKNVTMTLQGTSTYFGQIPAQDHEVSVVYHIIARDTLNNVATTDDIVISVVGDTDEPEISILDLDLDFDVGETIVIHVTVTDDSDISSVILQYVIDNVTYNVTMTLDDAHTYFGQIPTQNRVVNITYRIIAEDAAGNIAITEDIHISIVEPSNDLFLQISFILLVVLLMLMAYLYLSRPIIDEVFVMYQDGTLLAHQTRRLKPGMDDQILGGMLIALQNFVRDSFKDESSTVLRRMDFGERKILVERKDDFFMAVVLSGKRAGSAPQRMMKVLDQIEEGYSQVLNEWDGDLDKVRGIRDETKPIFQRTNPLERLRGKKGEGDSF